MPITQLAQKHNLEPESAKASISDKAHIIRKPRKVCYCTAYKFPHRLDSGKCRELYNEQAKEQQDWDAYFAQRSVQDRQLHQSGHSAKDF